MSIVVSSRGGHAACDGRNEGRRCEPFVELYRVHYSQLVALCRRCLAGRGDAEALAQEAFVRAWISLDQFSEARPFWPWVATIARRLCIDQRRRLERERDNLHIEAAANQREIPSPEECVEVEADRRWALWALRNLKPAEQRVIALRDLNGWSYDEIARFEGVSVESIRSSLKRARAALRRSFLTVSGDAPVVIVLSRTTYKGAS